jgi:hypothetical protein
MTDVARNLSETWGDPAPFSDYKPGESIRYRAPGGEVSSGTIIWCAAGGPSAIEEHQDLPLRYIVARSGWSEDSFPDVVYSADIISSDGEELVLVKCPWCPGLHYKGQEQYCDRNPNKP